MTTDVLARISRISFLTDMTRADSPAIPLGYLFESVWPTQIRWLGLIGRLQLTPAELGHVNISTWPELKTPFDLLMSTFEVGWAAEWGHAGDAVEDKWRRSALDIEISERSQLLLDKRVDSPEAWAGTSNFLVAELLALQTGLVPTIKAEVVSLRPAVSVRPSIPGIGQQVKYAPQTEMAAAA